MYSISCTQFSFDFDLRHNDLDGVTIQSELIEEGTWQNWLAEAQEQVKGSRHRSFRQAPTHPNKGRLAATLQINYYTHWHTVAGASGRS